MMRRRLAAGFAAAAIATGIAATTGQATASAAQFQQSPTGVNVWLTHAETVDAARAGLANYLESPAIRSQLAVYLGPNSRYRSALRTGPGGKKIINVRNQALVAEAASHPTGRIGILITPPKSTRPVAIAQYWTR